MVGNVNINKHKRLTGCIDDAPPGLAALHKYLTPTPLPRRPPTVSPSHPPILMATKTGKSALLLGGTGAVGKKLLAELLASDEWTRVGEYGRRVSAPTPESSSAGKLEQKTIDFEALDGAGLKAGRWDVVFVTLGTTRANAGSAAQFEKIDRECVWWWVTDGRVAC